jgi:hypothetical protein
MHDTAPLKHLELLSVQMNGMGHIHHPHHHCYLLPFHDSDIRRFPVILKTRDFIQIGLGLKG